MHATHVEKTHACNISLKLSAVQNTHPNAACFENQFFDQNHGVKLSNKAHNFNDQTSKKHNRNWCNKKTKSGQDVHVKWFGNLEFIFQQKVKHDLNV